MKKFDVIFKSLICLSFIFSSFVSVIGQTPITDVAGLKAVSTALEDNYILMNDIDLDGVTWVDDDLSWDFKGTFDGNGFVIKNFTFDATPEKTIGFFRILKNGTVKNLGFDNASVNGADKTAGIIVGESIGGTIENCFVVNSSVTGTKEFTGPIVGKAKSSSLIEKCYVDNTTITGKKNVGGLIGRLETSTIKLSYSSNSIIFGEDNVGGLTGSAWGVFLIENSYSTSSVTSTKWQDGGLLGATDWNQTGTPANITNCYFAGALTNSNNKKAGGILGISGKNSETNIQGCVVLIEEIVSTESYRILMYETASAGVANNNYALENLVSTSGDADENGEDVSTEDAKTQQFYETTVGWDFSNTWFMSSTSDYPQLKAFGPEVGTSTIQIEKEADYNMYVTNNVLNISGLSKNTTISIYTIDGRVVSADQASDKYSTLLPRDGVYLVKVSEISGATYVNKIISK